MRTGSSQQVQMGLLHAAADKDTGSSSCILKAWGLQGLQVLSLLTGPR